MKKIVSMFMLAALLCALCVTAYAAEAGSVWLAVTGDETATTVNVVTDTTVTDGQITVTYDAEKLTYAGVETDEAYVAVYAVNAEETGKVVIAWVAPEAYAADGSGKILLKVLFTGTEGEVTVEGAFRAFDGSEVPMSEGPDTTALEAALAAAAEVDPALYTEETVAALNEAVAAAEAVLADPAASQADVDAATKALEDAIAALKEIVKTDALEEAIAKAEKIDTDKYTEETVKALEEALAAAKEVLAKEDATQEEVDAAAKALNDAMNGLKFIPTEGPPTGDTTDTVLLMAMAVVSVAAAAVLVTLRRRYAR